MRSENEAIRILFIGNSLTYVQDLPERVARLAREEGHACEVFMLAHGGWTLAQHLREPDVRFNLRYGRYDCVVLQEYSHPFPAAESYLGAVTELAGMARAARALPIIYGTWSMQDEPHLQAEMDRIHEEAARQLGCPLAPVGALWWPEQDAHPEVSLYCPDREHASAEGAQFAAGVLWNTIRENLGA